MKLQIPSLKLEQDITVKLTEGAFRLGTRSLLPCFLQKDAELDLADITTEPFPWLRS